MNTVQPYHQFKNSVARTLQGSPYDWAGPAGFELMRKYEDRIDVHWQSGATAEMVADLIHSIHMERPQVYGGFPTRDSLIACGCVYKRA